MPKRIDNARRRRGAAAEIALEREPNAILRVVLRSPKDTLAVAVAVAAVVGILANALVLQAGRHPSPFFKTAAAPPAPVAQPLPRVRPPEADAKSLDFRQPEKTEPRVEQRSDRALPAAAAAKADVPRPPAPVPTKADAKSDPMRDLIANSGRVAAVQRALTEYGYGQLKPTGLIGPDTSSAISRFERERKMPPTGQLSEKLIRDLATLTGRPIE